MNIHLTITTHCNRRCPECCCNIGTRPLKHFRQPYFERAALFMRGRVDRLRITGGEPLVHPEFDALAPQWKGLFGCNVLELETNGDLWSDHTEALRNFDLIIVSRQGGNEAEVWEMVKILGAKTSPAIDTKTPRSRRGSGEKCFRAGLDIAAYSDGRLYGCCVAPGIPGAASAPLTDDWENQARGLSLPCKDCLFSP